MLCPSRHTADLGCCQISKLVVYANEHFQFHSVFFKGGVSSELKMEVIWYKERRLHHMQATISQAALYLNISFQPCLFSFFTSKASQWLLSYKLSCLTRPRCNFSSVKLQSQTMLQILVGGTYLLQNNIVDAHFRPGQHRLCGSTPARSISHQTLELK